MTRFVHNNSKFRNMLSKLAGSHLTPMVARFPMRGIPHLLYRAYAAGPPLKQVEATTDFGDRLCVQLASYIDWHVWAFGTYEPEMGTLFPLVVRPSATTIDVGANIGVHTVRLAKLAHRVIAFEPDPVIADRLELNLEANHLTNVEVLRAAAGAVGSRTMTLYRSPEDDPNRGRASLLQHDHLSGQPIHVAVVAIDDLQLHDVGLIKIDVEGAESHVMAGAWETIHRSWPHIVFEWSPEYSSDYDFVEELRELGYSFSEVRRQRNRLTGRSSLRLLPLVRAPFGGLNVLASPSFREATDVAVEAQT